ncbi:hypothetical protein B0T24DRAFT_679013 [Lasiosphaeria ovina]|uniref:Uncharacterized protein n=1 Tax=Lasiosphaeria ovina TaxID=92902 RepID=A0AAE0N7H7_9PEZI|nr:hypothetical protein B0T24DRAFT_679013 [Lasiosphaeria ovina]
MPSTKRDFYTSESPGRDFSWFSFRSPAPTTSNTREKAEPSTTYSNAKRRRRSRMATVSEGPKEHPAMLLPATALDNSDAMTLGPWSEWAESGDKKYFWRARQTPNGTWGYQYREGDSSASVKRKSSQYKPPRLLAAPSTTATTTASAVMPTTPKKVHGSESPTNSWPTIITTSTGMPTDVDDSNSSAARTTSTKLAAEESSGHALRSPRPMITGPAAIMAKIVLASPPSKKPKRPPSSSRGSRPAAPAARRPMLLSLASLPLQGKNAQQQQHQQQQQKRTGQSLSKPPIANHKSPKPKSMADSMAKSMAKSKKSAAVTATATTTAATKNNSKRTKAAQTAKAHADAIAQAKRLHNKLKSEKELKIDTKKRVRGWLKDVPLETTTPAPWDHPL